MATPRKPAAKPVAKPAAKSGAKSGASAAPQAAAKPVTKQATPAPVKAAAAPKTLKAPAPQTAKPTAPKAEKKGKPEKVKVVRDSFTIPKSEYAAIAELKKRALAQGSEVKKSELLRAGLMLLAAASDAAFGKALAQVPTLKTGRPGKA